MKEQHETVGTVAKIFQRSGCVGFYPTEPIAIGDVLALQRPYPGAAAEPVITFVVKSMEVNHTERDVVLPGEPCAIQIDPFPVRSLGKGLIVLRKNATGTDQLRLEAMREFRSRTGQCPMSPSGIHTWKREPKQLYQPDEPPCCCTHCGSTKPHVGPYQPNVLSGQVTPRITGGTYC